MVARITDSGIDYYWVNDTTHFVIDGAGVVRNVITLPGGLYDLEVRVYNLNGHYCFRVFRTAVQDTTPPIPGFPITAITLGLVTALSLLVLRRRHRRKP